MPKVSVIIPVYGAEQWLDDCLESVCEQTLEDIEIICVDDCSCDSCPTMLDDWAIRDERMRVIHLPENRGQGHARNVGLDQAVGYYVYFLDADDMVEARVLEELSAIADTDALDGAFFEMRVLFDNPLLEERLHFDRDERTGSHPLGVVSGQELFASFVSQHDWVCYVQRQLWRREFLVREGIRFPDWVPHEDEPFSFEAILLARRVRYCPHLRFVRRYREGSAMTSRLDGRNLLGYVRDYLRMTRFVRDRGIMLREVHAELNWIYLRAMEVYGEIDQDSNELIRLFDEAGCLDVGLVFCESQQSHIPCNYLGSKAIAVLRRFERVFVYGAGVIAKRVDAAIRGYGLAHDGFVVSDLCDNPAFLRGHHVNQVDRVSPEGAIAIVAVSRFARAEVERVLEELGWDYVYYKE